MIFYSHANKTHKKGFTRSFVLKLTGFGTRNWPITSMAEFILQTNYPSETDNSYKFTVKFSAKTNCGAKFV